MLMFQPETGNISLNLTATKHLFQAIGGKLIVRQRPQQKCTIFPYGYQSASAQGVGVGSRGSLGE